MSSCTPFFENNLKLIRAFFKFYIHTHCIYIVCIVFSSTAVLLTTVLYNYSISTSRCPGSNSDAVACLKPAHISIDNRDNQIFVRLKRGRPSTCTRPRKSPRQKLWRQENCLEKLTRMDDSWVELYDSVAPESSTARLRGISFFPDYTTVIPKKKKVGMLCKTQI